MKECSPGREQDFVDEQTDNDDNKHDPNHLIHRVEFATEMKQLAQAEAGQDRHINLRRHSRFDLRRKEISS
jgi:hypothetical protein